MEDAQLAATFAATLKRPGRRIVGPTAASKEIVSDTRSPRYRAPVPPPPQLHVHDLEALQAYALSARGPHKFNFPLEPRTPQVRVLYGCDDRLVMMYDVCLCVQSARSHKETGTDKAHMNKSDRIARHTQR